MVWLDSNRNGLYDSDVSLYSRHRIRVHLTRNMQQKVLNITLHESIPRIVGFEARKLGTNDSIAPRVHNAFT